MNKVITINLNNNAFQVEEQGYDALQAYLDKAAAKLQDNPDKDEITADLEQAIADKSAKYLNGHKNVITAKEVDEVIAAMGPVEDVEPEEATAKADATASSAPRRLFKIREGAIFEGVCNGIAAYFDVDPTLVRVGFIVLTILTGGAWILAYILMAIFIPEARTREDIASAQGKAFNARTVMEQAHDRYEYWKHFGKEQQRKWKEYEEKDKAHWKHEHKSKKHEHRAAVKAHRAALEKKYAWKQPVEPEEIKMPSLGTRIGRGFAGWFGGIGVLVLIGLWLAWALGVWAIFTNGTILGYFSGAPKLALLAVLAAAFYVVYLPVQSIVSDALRYASGKVGKPRFWGKVVAIAIWFIAYVVIYAVAVDVGQIQDGFGQMWQDISHQL